MSNRRSTASHTSHKQTRHEILQILAIVPLVVGGLLLLTAFTGLIVWDTAESQVVMGCLYILISFGASNAIQKKVVTYVGVATTRHRALVVRERSGHHRTSFGGSNR